MIYKNFLICGLSCYFLEDVLRNTKVFNFHDVQFVSFFFCCLYVPDVSLLPLLLGPYIPSFGFWLGQGTVVLWTGTPSPKSLLFLPLNPLLPLSSTRSSLFHSLAHHYIQAEDSRPLGCSPSPASPAFSPSQVQLPDTPAFNLTSHLSDPHPYLPRYS